MRKTMKLISSLVLGGMLALPVAASAATPPGKQPVTQAKPAVASQRSQWQHVTMVGTTGSGAIREVSNFSMRPSGNGVQIRNSDGSSVTIEAWRARRILQTGLDSSRGLYYWRR